MIFPSVEAAADRRALVSSSPMLQHIGGRLDRDLELVRSGPVFFPEEKPLLSRTGGVCALDGARLVFDPGSPDAHRCPACDRVESGDLHHRAWSWRYLIWLSERALHGALLSQLGVSVDGAGLAGRLLDLFTERYSSFPNRDNVLGPSRMFFSTYLESIWLTQLVAAAQLLGDDGSFDRRAFTSVVEESAGLIHSFDEGWSNRQVWNNLACMMAGVWLEDDGLVRSAIHGQHGLSTALDTVVTDDGWWHEGENYHFFALHAFQLFGQFTAGTPLDPWVTHETIMNRMHVAPLDTLFPDLTFPARGDSPHGVSVAQPRFAQMWELGRARSGDERIAGILRTLYDYPGEARDNGQAEISEVETHRPAGAVQPDGLGWKMLAWGVSEPVDVDAEWIGGSSVVRRSGPVVLRHGRRMAILETGSGSGHGHPDGMHLSLYDRAHWLTDFGTGSYVAESLHWYRSSAAHNAPFVAVSRRAGPVWCSGLASTGSWELARVTCDDLAGTLCTRTVIMGPDYFLEWVDASPVDAVMPMHLQGLRAGATPVFGQPLTVESDGHQADVTLFGPDAERTLEQPGLGPPSLFFADGAECPHLVRHLGAGSPVGSVLAPVGTVRAVEAGPGRITIEGAGGRDVIRFDDEGVEVDRNGTKVFLPVDRKRPESPRAPSARVKAPHVWAPMLSNTVRASDGLEEVPWSAVHPLRESNYRRSEESFPGEDDFAVRVATWVQGEHLLFGVEVRKPDLVNFTRDTTVLDNDPPHIHADGAQCYWSNDAEPWTGVIACLTAEGAEGVQGVDVVDLHGQAIDEGRAEATVHRLENGYTLIMKVHDRRRKPGDTYRFNVVVNEGRAGRRRRAGQMAFVGGGGWVYLRGAHEPPTNFAVAEVR